MSEIFTASGESATDKGKKWPRGASGVAEADKVAAGLRDKLTRQEKHTIAGLLSRT